VDVVATTPRNIQVSGDNPVPVVDAAVLYGFTVSSLSSYTAFLSKKADSEHSEYPSFDLATLMYEDIRDDGVLDGKGLDKETGEPTQLIFANVELAQDVYRSAIAQHMLIMANSPANKTGVSAQDLLENAKRLATSNTPEFPGVGGEPSLDIDGPTITSVEPEGLYYSAVLNFAVKVEDSSPIASVNFDVDGDPLGNTIDVANPVVAIDTTKYADGEHTIGITAFDDIGNLNSANFTVFFDNTDPMVVIGSTNITNLRTFTIFGTYERNGSDLSLFQIQGGDVVVAADNTWQSDILLDPGVNTIPIVAVDGAGNRAETTTLVSLDERLPKFSQLRYSQATVFFADPGCFISPLDTADVNGRPLYFNNSKLVLSELIQQTLQKTQYGWVDLELLKVPYFRFFVEDQRNNPSDVFTPSGEIIVRMQYALGNTVLVPWQRIQVHIDPSPSSPYYLIPLASDTLHPDWSMAAATDIHTISVELEDLAGNKRSFEFLFKAFFDANDCTIN